MPNPIRSLIEMLDALEHAAHDGQVSLRDVVQEFGDRSITPFILLVALALITPLSGIPGMPTVSALLIWILTWQALLGKRRLWLPDFMLNRHITAEKLSNAVQWLRKPCAVLDRHARQRLTLLTKAPVRQLTLAVILILSASWPILEILPFATTIGAFAVGLLAFGLFTHDGLWVLFGFGMIILFGAAVLYFLS